MDLDEILIDIGEFGKYQKYVVLLILLPGSFPCGFHAYNQLFMAAVPDHWCRTISTDPKHNYTEEYLKNISIPIEMKDGKQVFSSCSMYDSNSAKRISCTNGWTFDRSKYEETVISEWDLVCDRDLLPTLALVLLGLGGLIGNYVFGYVQDGLGRRPAFFIYLAIQCVFGIATAFAGSFTTWTIFRIGVGFTVPAILGTPYVLAIELVGPRYRTTVIVLINIAYSLSLVSLAVIVWLIREWRLLALSTSVPFLLLFAFWWTLPESPRWLIAKGRYEEAERILNKMAKINGKRSLTHRIVEMRKRLTDETDTTDQSTTKKINYGMLDLFKYPRLRWKTTIITFIWFTNTSVYVGLSYYAPSLGGNEFLNFFLAGAVELPTYLFLWPAMERWGRRWSLCASMIVGGTACLATFLVQDDSVVTIALYCVGKMGISSSFVVLPLMASEIYPTVVRGIGMSTSSVMGMFGPVLIPLVNYLGHDMLTLPLIIMGAMLVIGGVCSLLLPETLNQHLPQTLLDGEKVGLDCFACCTPPQVDANILLCQLMNVVLTLKGGCVPWRGLQIAFN